QDQYLRHEPQHPRNHPVDAIGPGTRRRLSLDHSFARRSDGWVGELAAAGCAGAYGAGHVRNSLDLRLRSECPGSPHSTQLSQAAVVDVAAHAQRAAASYALL